MNVTIREIIKGTGIVGCVKVVKRGKMITATIVPIVDIDYLDNNLVVHEPEDGELKAIEINNKFYDISYCSQWQSMVIDGMSCDYKYLV